MKALKIRNITIGEGIPKICVPIVAQTSEEIFRAAERIKRHAIDLVEWRADWYEEVEHPEKIKTVLEKLREILEEIPILFTFRTLREGGHRMLSPEAYMELNLLAASSGCVDLVDVEMFWPELPAKDLVEKIQVYQVKVVGSNHDFSKTPEKDEIVRRLCVMQEQGADIPKIAVMPTKKSDVLTLLSATETMAAEYADRPVITMSMASDGVISRISGEIFGSSVTFGAVGETSAPGQVEVSELKEMLRMIHQSR